MGLDNFFMVHADKNGTDELIACNYKGEELPGSLCIGMFSCVNENDDGTSSAFRGKFYGPMVDALLDKSGWLYADRTKDEIRSAWESMKSRYDLAKSGEHDEDIRKFLEPLHYEYTKEDLLTFLTFFKYYAEDVDDETLELRAWY
jgi:hypothetical protein